MTSSRTRRGKFRRGVEIILLITGLAAICIWLAGTAAPIVSEDWSNWLFDREVNGRSATVREYLHERKDKFLADISSEWKTLTSGGRRAGSERIASAPVIVRPNTGDHSGSGRPKTLRERDLIGRLDIPRLNLRTIVREGARENTLTIAAGHIPSTPLPGEPGNVGVAGHRDTLFRQLKGIQDGDLIQFETLSGNYVYRVESTQIVKPADVGVLKPGRDPELTLVTCYPFTYIGSAPDRFIVKARQVFTAPPTADLARESAHDAENTEAEAKVPNSDAIVTSSAVARRRQRSEQARTDPQDDSGGQSSKGSQAGTKKISFAVPNNHSRQLAPGISMGVNKVELDDHAVSGWLWIMPDRHTVWIDHQALHTPLTFYQEGQIRELVLTNATADSASGYLLFADDK